MTNHTATKDEWFIAYNNEVTHYGSLLEGQTVSTKLENFEIYDTEQEWKDVLLNNFQIKIDL